MHEWPADVERLMRAAGWYEGRDSSDFPQWVDQLRRQGGFEPFLAAERALREFGGLEATADGPGIDLGRSGFNATPTLCVFEDDRFEEASVQLGERLYPLGEIHGGYDFFAVGESGRVFAGFLIGTGTFTVLGSTVAEALANILLGRRPDSSRNV